MLMEGIGGYKEVRYWLKHYADNAKNDAFAVIKVGGGVLDDPNLLQSFCNSVRPQAEGTNCGYCDTVILWLLWYCVTVLLCCYCVV